MLKEAQDLNAFGTIKFLFFVVLLFFCFYVVK
jgi:hypothetical protein